MRAVGPVLGLLTVLPALAGCFGGSGAVDPDAVHLVVNAKIWTASAAQPEAQTLAFQNRTIVFVGDESEARVMFPEAIVHDVGGRRLTPGLIDSHSHFVRVASDWGCASDTNPFSPTFDNSQLAGIEFEISRVQLAAGHHQTNVSGQTPVDDETVIGDRASAERGLVCAMEQANAMGLTMNVEAGISSWDYLTVLESLEAKDKVTMRHSLYLTPPQIDEAKRRGIQNGWGTDYVRVAGVKLYSDGWLGPRTAALLAPYDDRPGTRGVLFLEQEEANQMVKRALGATLKPATHTIGDQGVAVVSSAYLAAQAPNATGIRFTFEHASLVNPQLIARMIELGATASYQLSFATSDQRFAESALGAQRVENVYNWKTMLDAGVVLAGGSDFPIEPLPPLWGLQRVVTRQDLDGTPPGGWMPEQRLTVEEALRTITINAAYNVWMEDQLGSLEVGKLADFVVFQQDILTIDPHEIAKTCVFQTWVGGELVYDSAKGLPCRDVAYTGVLVRRDPAVVEAIERKFEREALQGTRLG